MSKVYYPSTTKGLWGQQNPAGIDAEIAARLRDVPLVPWAVGKCLACGSTLCVDPLPHACGRFVPHAIDPGKCAL